MVWDVGGGRQGEIEREEREESKARQTEGEREREEYPLCSLFGWSTVWSVCVIGCCRVLATGRRGKRGGGDTTTTTTTDRCVYLHARCVSFVEKATHRVAVVGLLNYHQ